MRFAVLGFISALSVATAALGAAGDGLTIQGNRVNMRADASTGAPVVLQLDRGDRVVEVGRRGNWVAVEVPHHGGRRGWVHRSLVAPVAGAAAAAAAPGEAPQPGAVPMFDGRPVAGAEAPAAAAGGPAIEIEAMGARIRGGPTTDAPVIAKLNRGATLPRVGQRGNWLQVRLDDGRVGWVHNSLTSTVEGAPPATAAAPPGRRQEATAGRPTPPAPEAAPAAPETAAAAEEAEEAPAPAAAAEPAPAAAGEERPTAAFAAEGRPRLEVAATTVSLRREPSRLAPVVTRLDRGSEVVELDRRDEWVEVGVAAPGGARGWVHGSLVSPVEAGATAAAEEGSAEGEAVAAAPEPEERTTAETLAEAVGAAEGAGEATPAESLAITGNRVNIRGGPSTRAPVVTQLNRGAEVSGLDRRGAWVRIALDRPGGREGWVHESLVAPRAAAPAPEEKAPEGSRVVEAPADAADDDKFDRFRSTVEHLNERVRRAAGVDVFAEVEEVGEGTVELTATEAWLSAPEAARRANLDTLFRLWGSVHDPDQPIVVRIVDDAGEVAMEKRRDEQPAAAGRRSPTAGG